MNTAIAHQASGAEQTAFTVATDALRERACRIGLWLTVVAVPAGVTLDLLVYPDDWMSFALLRLTCTILAAALLVVLNRAASPSLVCPLGLVWPLLPIGMIALMIGMTDGAASPYYAGLNLVLLAACLLMPYSRRESLVLCGVTLGMYLIACIAQMEPVPLATLGSNVFFIVMTSLACVTAGFFWTRTRLESYRLQSQLDARAAQLAETNAQLEENNEKIAEADRIKTEFFANVSHELRTPLTLILTPVEELLADDTANGKHRIDLDTIRRNALRLLKLINDLLEIVRLDDAAKHWQSLQREPVDVVAFARGVFNGVKPLASGKSIDQDVQVDAHSESQPPIVSADASQLERLLLNLFTNAIKFTPAGGRVTLAVRSPSDDSVVVEVRDTGIGIEAESLETVFDRFRQADGTTTRQYQGAGLGLALARQIAEVHGGTLDATSTVGEGTTMRLTLPLAAEISDEIAPLTSAPRSASTGDPMAEVHFAANRLITPDVSQQSVEPSTGEPASTGCVLIIEDEPDMRKLLVRLLEPAHEVLTADDGAQGLVVAKQSKPDVIVCDLMMPGKSGHDVIEELRARDDFLGRIILVTARGDETTKLASLQLGADDFLVKPFSGSEVRARVKTLMDNVRLERSLRRHADELSETLDQLRQAEAELLHGEKMKALGKLSAGILHEVNNPLNFTKAAADYAKMELAELPASSQRDAMEEALSDIIQGLNRIAGITTDLHRFAHPTAMDVRERVAVESLMQMATRLVSHAARHVAVEIRDDTDGGQLLGSETHLVQVLVGLLLNAIDAVDDIGNPRIAITAEQIDSHVRLTVEDNGTGVDENDLDQLTVPFFTRKAVGEGTGLGLAICSTILESHASKLQFANRTDGTTGLRVWLDLPYVGEPGDSPSATRPDRYDEPAT